MKVENLYTMVCDRQDCDIRERFDRFQSPAKSGWVRERNPNGVDIDVCPNCHARDGFVKDALESVRGAFVCDAAE